MLALSPLQQGLYSMTMLTGSEHAEVDPYVIAMAAEMSGELDIDLLRRCAAAMLVRHPNLRASFFRGDLPGPCRSSRTTSNCPGGRSAPTTPTMPRRWKTGNAAAPFNRSRGRLIRFLLIELPAGVGVW